MSKRVLVAGVGNIFLGDDAFGVVVARQLFDHPLPNGAEVQEFGIRGFDLACAMLDGFDAVILVDALPRGDPPGTLYVFEPDVQGIDDTPDVGIEAHGLTPERVIALARRLGGPLPPIYVIGCEPGDVVDDTESLFSLSPEVERAIEPAVDLVKAWCERLLSQSLATGAEISREGSSNSLGVDAI